MKRIGQNIFQAPFLPWASVILIPSLRVFMWVWGNTDWNCPRGPGTIVAVGMSDFTRGLGKVHGTNKPLLTRKVWERSKGDSTCPPTSQNPSCWLPPPRILPAGYHLPESFLLATTSQNPSCWHPSWLSNTCAIQKDPESEWLTRENLETNSVTIKPGTASHMAQQFSWAPWPSSSPRRRCFPIKSLALSACVSKC